VKILALRGQMESLAEFSHSLDPEGDLKDRRYDGR
jgi:hypothetical protein